MIKNLTKTLVASGLLAASWSANAQTDNLRPHLLLGAKLEGAQEVPAVNTAAQGVCAATLNATRDTVFVSASFSGLSGAVTGVHFHEGAPGVNGPVVVNLLQMLNGNRLQGFLAGPALSSVNLSKMLRGQFYLNVHTAANPNGEIRGQVLLEADAEYVSVLSGAAQVPPVTTAAGGFGFFTLAQAQDRMKFRVVTYGLSGPITNVHFHTGGPGVVGPVVVPLLSYVNGNVVEGEITSFPAGFLANLASGQIYFNVHTAANPAGEIRGQVLTDPRYLAHDARLDAAQVVPATSATGKGALYATISPTFDTLRVVVAHTGLTGAPTSLTINQADLGQANNASNLLANVAIPAGTPNAFSVRFTNLPATVINQALRGGLNVSLNTAANPNGELRGQVYRVAREGYTFAMNGAQQVPANASPGYGAGLVSIDRDETNAHFMAVWGNTTGPVTLGHFHTGLRGQNGPVVFNLAQSFNVTPDPKAAYGFWTNTASTNAFNRRRSEQFRKDSMYINVHTAMFPGGELRGQVYRGARNLSRVLSARGPAALLAESVTAAPNPFGSELTLAFEARVSGAGRLRVADVLGRPVAERPVQVRAGANALPVQLPAGAAPGVYLLTVEVGETRVVTRVTKE